MGDQDFYKDKRVLVTGGAGFIGIHLVEELLRQGARVRAPVHLRPLEILDDRLEVTSADLSRQEDCLRVMSGVQYVFHAAGSAAGVGESGLGAMSGIAVNLTLTAHVLLAAWTAKAERVLVFGSSTAYPEADHPVKEEELWSAPPYPAYMGYGWMRRYIERLAEFVARESSTKLAIVRPTAVYGPHDNFDPKRSHVVPALVRRAAAKENPFTVWGTGNEVRDFLHVRDFSKGCLLVLEKHANCDPVNVGSGEGATIKHLVEVVLAASRHRDAEVRFDPSQPGAIPFRVADITKARLLGFSPSITLEDGIVDTVRWYVESRKKAGAT